MQNQHVETSSRPPAAVTSPPGGRRRTSPAICHPGVQTRHALVRISLVFPTPVGVASASLRAVPSFPLDRQFPSSVAVDPDPDLPPDATSGEGERDATIDISRIRPRTGCVAFA